jgi:tetratricopeptide (TPR) repeat protein
LEVKLHQVGHESESFASYFNLGVDYRREGNMQKAIEAWTQALHIDPTNTHAYYNRGITKADIGDYKEAIEDLAQVIRLNPKYSNAYRQRDKIYQFYNVAENELEEYYKNSIENFLELYVDAYGKYPNYWLDQNELISNQSFFKTKLEIYKRHTHDYDYESTDCYTQKGDEYHDLILEGEEYTESTLRASDGWFYAEEDYDSYESFVRWNG